MTAFPVLYANAEIQLLAFCGVYFDDNYFFCAEKLPVKESTAWTKYVTRIKRISGRPGSIRLDHPIIDVDTFTSSYADSDRVSREVQAALMSIRGQIMPVGGVIKSVITNVGPRSLPDSNPNLFRFSATYEITNHT